jgi:peptidoglycan pentaglycine glycine transferase (the first glycine)
MKLNDWNSTLLQFENSHILQTAEWGDLKSRLGWKPIYFSYPPESKFPSAISLILERQIRFGGFSANFRILYAPKGPILDWDDPTMRSQVLTQLEQLAHHEKAIFLKIDPDIVVGTGLPGPNMCYHPSGSSFLTSELLERGWTPSTEQIQFRNTIHLELNDDEEILLSRMKQKTRYNIRLSSRKGIRVRLGSTEDLSFLFHCYAETSIRDGFVIRDREYYLQTWGTFLKAGLADILIAEYESELVAGLILFRFGRKAWYMYGMSRDVHRDKMPSYLLQWEAIKRAKQMGCAVYDLWGAPDQMDESDPMWGVFRFKEGFGGTVIRTIGAWDYPVQPLLYRFYTHTMPRILELMRWRGKQKTKKLLDV